MAEKKEHRINLKQIVVTAVITGVVAVATGILLFNLQRTCRTVADTIAKTVTELFFDQFCFPVNKL